MENRTIITEQDQATITEQDQATVRLRELFAVMLERSAGDFLRLMCEAGLTMPQMVTLHALRRSGALTISAISGKLDLSLAATSHLVDRMVQQQLVERSEDASDRRQKRVAITPAGLALLGRLSSVRLAKAARVIEPLAPELRAQLAEVLAEVLEQIRQD